MTWTIVLAGGQGSRLCEESRRRFGYARPKQYCDFDGNGSLLERTLARARRVSQAGRIVVVTTRAHRSEADEALRGHPDVVQVEQPGSRDTTPGILLPLLYVLAREPTAPVVLLPADHHFVDEELFGAAVDHALALVAEVPWQIAVLGAEPAGPIDDLGWLVPDDERAAPSVRAFREKPDRAEIDDLIRQGALVNTMVLVGRARTLSAVFARWAPGWWRAMTAAARDPERLEAAYDVLPPSNFSRDVLENIPQMLRMVRVPAAAGWSDIGTPTRLAQALTPPPAAGRDPGSVWHRTRPAGSVARHPTPAWD